MKKIHLGPVGLVANARWFEMADFVAGFTTLDLSLDDGKKFGHWIWLPDREPAAPPVTSGTALK